MPRRGPGGRTARRSGLSMGAFVLSGVTRDSTGAILGGCTVKRYRTNDDVELQSTTSDPTTGAYSFQVPMDGQPYYLVAYLPGSPDVAGTTVNTLTGS